METTAPSFERQITERRFNGLTAAATGYVLLTGLLLLSPVWRDGLGWSSAVTVILLCSLTQIEEELRRGADRPAILGLRSMSLSSILWSALLALWLSHAVGLPFLPGVILFWGLELVWPDSKGVPLSKSAEAIQVSHRYLLATAAAVPLFAMLQLWDPVAALVVSTLWFAASNRIESRITGGPLSVS